MGCFRPAILIAAAVSGYASMASAADLPTKAPIYKAPVAIPYSWTGFYIGAQVGYGFNNTQTDFIFAGIPGLPGTPVSVSPNGGGFLVGAQAGYNYQFNNFVVGLEGDIAYAHLHGNGTSVSPSGFFMAPTEQDINWLGTVRGRVGILPTDRLLVFATGGLAFGEVSMSTGFVPTGLGGGNCTNSSCGSGSTSATKTGWTVGGGLEYAYSNQISFKAEYLYVDLGSTSITFPLSLAVSQMAANSEFRTHIVRAGVNYKF